MRCQTCSRKVSEMNYFECKCIGVYCARHRLPFDHECTYDWKEEKKIHIRKDNPVTRKRKVDLI
jgi:hypothetical protein